MVVVACRIVGLGFKPCKRLLILLDALSVAFVPAAFSPTQFCFPSNNEIKNNKVNVRLNTNVISKKMKMSL